MMGKGLYDLLAIPSSAAPDAIRATYRTQIALYHPDKVAALGSDLKALAEEHAKEINAAYATLSDPVRRAAYEARASERYGVLS